MTDLRRYSAGPAGFVQAGPDPQLDQRLIDVEDALKRREFEPAVALAESILRDAPDLAEAKRLLSAALRGCGRDDEAMRLLRELVVQQPDNALVHNSLGAALRLAGDLDGANAAFSRACELAPTLAPAWYNLAIIRLMRNDLEAALDAVERVVALVPTNEAARILRTDMMREQGRIKLVTAEYRLLLKHNPRLPWAWFGLANLKNVALTQADVETMQRAIETYPADSRERVALLFSLAKALDDLERYEDAFAALTAANAGVRTRLVWDAKGFSEKCEATLEAFTPPPAPARSRQGHEVIFVVSLPRSGSTLTEQILASHPQIEGGGERNELQTVIEEESQRRGSALAGWARDASPDDWGRLGKQYLQLTAQWRARRPRFVDKMLGNWRFAGAALSMLPETRIVVCRRDPVENGFSCYRQLFGDNGHAYSYDLNDMAAYWHDFDRMCRRWSELYPGRVFDMVYEDLLADQEGKTRELLDFCGLEFDPACLRFHETQRNIKTISSAQVREPLRRDTARAPYYGPLLDPLRVALGLPAYSEAKAGPG